MLELDKMDNFIKNVAAFYSEHKEFLVNPTDNSTFIYKSLKYYGLNNEEIDNPSIENKIEILKDNYRGSRHLNVYVSDEQPNFLQFTHSSNDENYVKLYLSTSKDYVDYVCQIIFDYINSKKIDTKSKVSNKLRSDSIVIRLTNEKDALDVLNFINNNHALSSLLKSTNPFMLKQGGVGVAWDGEISYNSELATLLAKYFEELSNKNSLATASISDFASYLKQFYIDTFENGSNLLPFSEEIQYRYRDEFKRFDSMGDAIANTEAITRLLILVCTGKLDMESYLKFYETCDKKIQKEQAIKYDELYVQLFEEYEDSLDEQEKTM